MVINSNQLKYTWIVRRSTSGLSLIEIMIYVAILTTTLILFVNLIISISGSYMTIKTTRKLDSAAIGSMDRMTREIRNSSSINISSLLGVESSRLVLDRPDEAQADFSVVDNQIHIISDGVDGGSLLPPGVTIPRFNIRRIVTGSSVGVKIEMTLEDREGGVMRAQRYYSTVVLRGSY